MGMINGQQLFAALSHTALRGEEFLRGRLVGDARISGSIAQTINGSRVPSLNRTADEPAALLRRSRARVRIHLFKVRALQSNHALILTLKMLWPSAVG